MDVGAIMNKDNIGDVVRFDLNFPYIVESKIGKIIDIILDSWGDVCYYIKYDDGWELRKLNEFESLTDEQAMLWMLEQ
jgi:hypothetical protein